MERLLRGLFRILLLIHPAEQRGRYGREMERVFGSVLRAAMRRGGPAPLVSVAARELFALVRTGARERIRGWGRGGMEVLRSEVRHAWGGVVARPLHALGVGIVVALGVGVHTLMLSVVHPVLLGPRLRGEGSPPVGVWTHGDDPSRGGPGIGTDLLFRLRGSSPLFRTLEGFSQERGILGGVTEPEWVWIVRGSPGLLDVFGVRPALGLDLRAGDGGARVALLSHDLWLRRFGGDPSVVGQPVDLDGERHTVAGVLPRGFHFPDRGPAVWVPIAHPSAAGAPAGVFAVGWLEKGLSVAAADTAIELLTPELRAAGLLDAGEHPWVLESVVLATPEPTRRALWVFFGAVTFTLVVATVNALGLGVARGLGRRTETAVRSALGCDSRRLARQFALEGAMSGIASGAAGFGIAVLGLDLLAPLLPDRLRMVAFGGLAVTPGHLAYALVLGTVVGVAVGVATALVARPGRSWSAAHGSTATGGRLTTTMRRTLVVAGVAFSFVLLAGTAVLGRSFLDLTRVEPGYVTEELLLAELSLPPSRRVSLEEADAFFARVRSHLASIPGVVTVGETTSPLPLSSARFRASLTTDADRVVEPGDFLPYDPVAPGYFRAAGIALLEGTEPSPTDPAGSVVVGATMARRLWPDGPAVGRRFRVNDEEWLTVRGVAEDVPHLGLRGTEHGMAYYLRLEDHARRGTSRVFLLRTSADPSALAPAARAALREIDAELPFRRLEPMEDVLADSIERERFYASLVGFFAVVAAGLAALGLYAALAQQVGARTREIGIRMALGADGTRVFGGLLAQAVGLTLGGIALGGAASLALSRVLGSLLYGVSPHDPLALAVTMAVFLLLAGAACAVPGVRAVRVDPVRTLTQR